MSINITLLRDSFDKLRPFANEIPDKFYEFLWGDYPAAKELFTGVDMQRQKKALLNSLVHIVDHLDSPKLESYLMNMGARHLNYNTQEEHYPLVGASLLKTFAYFFDDEWNSELETAWGDAYSVITQLMLKGANEALKKEEEKMEKVDIRGFAKNLCKELVDEILDQELESLVKENARPKIKKLILETLKEESQSILKKSKVA